MSTSKGLAPQIYAFIGEDSFSMLEKIETWVAAFSEKHGAFGIRIFNGSDGNECDEQLRASLNGSPLFQAKSLIILKNPWSSKRTEIQSLLLEKIESLPDTHFLVIADSGIDGRSALSKKLEQMSTIGSARIERFEIPKGPELRSWIRSRIKLLGGSFDTSGESLFIQSFILARETTQDTENASVDLWYLDHELRKLVSYSDGHPITVQYIRAISSLPHAAHIFQLTDSLLLKKREQAITLVHRLIDDDRSRAKQQLLPMIAFLITQFHSFVLFKSCQEDGMNDGALAKKLGWNAKRVWVVSKKISPLTCAGLTQSFSRILEYERVLKTGAGDPILGLDLLVNSLTQ